MQRIRTLGLAATVVGLALAAVPVAAADTDPHLTAEERQQLLELFAESKAMFLGLLAGVSDEQWSWKPAADRWSVGECAEHIMRSNQALWSSAQQALASRENPEWQEKTEGKSQLLLQVMPNRQPFGRGGATAPQEIRPTGEVSRSQIVTDFLALYEEAVKMVADTELPLKAHTSEHPFPIFGTLNAYDWIIYVPLHTVRHSRQMIEVMETDGYPGG
ncbi:MAG: DinB family protein [Thermoanaerobaculia bacterium]|nr:DinB family protein [Thermoanaerobaculia bacterium]